MNQYGKINWILIAVLAAIIVVLAAALLINGNNPEKPAAPGETSSTTQTLPSDALVIESVIERGEEVVVTTNYCTVTFPYAFSDLVKVEAVNTKDKIALQFFALIDGVDHKLYELNFGGEGTMKIGYLHFAQRMVNVYGTVYTPDSSLTGDNRLAFIAAQETFNEVAFSLTENEHFTPEQ